MRENTDQKNSEYGHFSRSDFQSGDGIFDILLVILSKKFSHKNLEFINSEEDGVRFLSPESSCPELFHYNMKQLY